MITLCPSSVLRPLSHVGYRSTTNAVEILMTWEKVLVQCFLYFDGNIVSFDFLWLYDYKRLYFCFFVQILSYDNVRERKEKLEIRSQLAKTTKLIVSRIHQLKSKGMYTAIPRFFMSLDIKVNILLLIFHKNL